MIHQTVLDQYNHETLRQIKRALAMLAESGVLEKQIESAFQSVAHGASTEEPEAVAKRVLQFRAESQALKALHLQGIAFLKELNDD